LTFVKRFEKCGVTLFDFAKSNLSFDYSKKELNEATPYRKIKIKLIKKTSQFLLIFEQNRIHKD